MVDMISIKTDSSVVPEIKFDTEKSTITNYPEYGSRYGNIKIESLDINLPLYYGDKLSILKMEWDNQAVAIFQEKADL